MIDLKLQIPKDFFEEEVRCGLTVTKERKELWAVQLDLLNEFDRVCRKYGLEYYADGGTALGAVRHNGFIPWDDDVDLSMFRSDYNMLCEIAAGEFSEPYFFQTEHTDRGSMRGHAQLRNSNTTGILMTELNMHLPFNQGIFIDIFPMDNLPENEHDRRVFIKRLHVKRELARVYARLTSRYYRCRASLKECVIRTCHAILGSSANPFYNSFEKYAQSYSKPSEKISVLCLPIIPDEFIWEKDWFRETVMMPFEMLNIPVCIDYDAYLTKNYGDWKTPVQAATYHGGVLIDTNNAYTKYIGVLSE